MTHAPILPDFSTRPADGDRVPLQADPVLAAIERHSEAWAVFQAAPGGEPALRAEDDSDAALMALLGTACATRAGMFCLERHLRWFLSEEASNAEGHGDVWAVAQAREADLSRCLGVERIERQPLALPSGRPIAPVSTPATEPHPVAAAPRIHSGRVLDRTGEVLAALVLIVGGCGLVGFATLL